MENLLRIYTLVLTTLIVGCNSDDNKNLNSNHSNSKYDLGLLPDIVADVEWPSEPNTTEQLLVTNDIEFQEAISVNGVSAKVLAGIYNDVNITCNDCEFILEDNAEIQGNLTFTGNHIHWVGGRVTTGPVVMNSTGDILIDNLHSITNTNGGELNNFSGPPTEWNRVAIINSTLEVINGDDSGDWALFVQGKNGTDFREKNFISANIHLESDAQNNRFQSIQNLVVVDSYFNSNITSKNN